MFGITANHKSVTQFVFNFISIIDAPVTMNTLYKLLLRLNDTKSRIITKVLSIT